MQTSEVTQYYPVVSPAVFHAASKKRLTKPDGKQDDEAVVSITTRLEAVALNQFDQLDQLDQFSVMEAATSEMALTQTTFEECQKQLSDKVFALVKDNGALGQQLVAAESREREVSRVHAQQVAAKDAQITSLQQQMNKLIADQQAETQRLHKMLKDTEQHKTTALATALATAQATWEQQKAQLNQQNSSLQAQVNSVTGQRDSLQAQVNSLQAQVNSAAQRQQVAQVTVVAQPTNVRANIEAILNSSISWCQSNPSRIWQGKVWDALDALQYVKPLIAAVEKPANVQASIENLINSSIAWCQNNPSRIWNGKVWDALEALQYIKLNVGKIC